MIMRVDARREVWLAKLMPTSIGLTKAFPVTCLVGFFKALSAVSAAGSSTLATFNAGGSLPENGILESRIEFRFSSTRSGNR